MNYKEEIQKSLSRTEVMSVVRYGVLSDTEILHPDVEGAIKLMVDYIDQLESRIKQLENRNIVYGK